MPSCALTTGYALDCKDSAGGITEVFFIEKANVSNIATSSGVVTGLTKASGKRFWKYELPKETGNFTHNPQVSQENGTLFFEQNLTIVVNKLSAAIKGGGSNEPTGIIANANVNVTFAGGATSNATNANGIAPVWADVVNLMKAVENANGDGVAYLTNPKVKAALQTIPRQTSGVEGNFIWPAGGMDLNGYQVATSTLVPSNLSASS